MDYLIHIANIIVIYAILALSLNLVIGYTGLLSVTQAVFYGIGAYTVAIVLTKTGLSFIVALLLAVGASGLVAFVIGLVLSRFKDDYYALVSLGFNTIVYAFFLNWQSATNGPLGISKIPRPAIWGLHFMTDLQFLGLALVLLGLIYIVTRILVRSSFGRVLQAIREDESAIRVFGYNTHLYKLTIFSIGAMMAAVAGGLFATYLSFIDPTSFTINESILIVAIIILGGLADLEAPMVGAIILIILPELLRFVGFPDAMAAELRQVAYGVLLVVLMLYRPQGLLGKYKL